MAKNSSPKRKSNRKPIKGSKTTQTVKESSNSGKSKKASAAKPNSNDPFVVLQGKIAKNFKVGAFATNLNTQAGLIGTIRAVSLHSTGKNTYVVQIAVAASQKATIEKRLETHKVPKENVRVVSCNALEFFEPSHLLATTFNATRILNSGSGGVFVRNGNRMSVFSAGHVFDTINGDMAVAIPRRLDSIEGTVTHSIDKLDLGIAQLDNAADAVERKIKMFTTKLEKAKDREQVRIFGGTSEMQVGNIESLDASPVIEGRQFHGLIQLNILAQPGDSGAAVINDKDEIIGLIIGGDRDPTTHLVYCSNLTKHKNSIPSAFRNNLKLYGTRTVGPIARQVNLPSTSNTRRDVEIWIHVGTLKSVASRSEYGEITVARAGSDDEDIRVLTHFEHSFEDKDGGKSMLGKRVFFFAIPLEYIVKPRCLRGLSNHSPLVALNVTVERKSLLSVGGFYKVTPCGGASTTQSSQMSVRAPLAMGQILSPAIYVHAKAKPVATAAISSKSKKKGVKAARSSKGAKSAEFINYVINDYGQLILVKSKVRPLRPFEKIIGQGIPVHKSPPRGGTGIANERLYYDSYIPDVGWKWDKEK